MSAEEENLSVSQEIAALKALVFGLKDELKNEREARERLEQSVFELRQQITALHEGNSADSVELIRSEKQQQQQQQQEHKLSNGASMRQSPTVSPQNVVMAVNAHSMLVLPVSLSSSSSAAVSSPTHASASLTTQHHQLSETESIPSVSFSKLFSFGEQEPDMNQVQEVISERFSQLQSCVDDIIAHFSTTTDEKELIALGDDTRNNTIVQITRGNFCTALINILYHGFIAKRLLGRYHIWDFFEKNADEFSRSDNQILQTIASGVSVVNVYEKMRKDNDMKIRSLICYALNYHQLHDWILCINPSNTAFSKWFEAWSVFSVATYRSSLAQILQPLANCPFLLSIDYEVDDS